MRYLYKILAVFLFVVYCTSLFAQVRTVTFTGRDRTNQYHIPLSQVKVFNLDQLWEEVLYYPDTILVLGSVGVEDYETGQNLQLMQNVPNPFDGTTEFALQLPDDRDVLLEIYDITGHLAVGERFAALSAGTHLFQATLSSPQTYLLSAKVDNGQMTIKMVNTGYGAGNTIRHLGMTDKNGVFTIFLKNDKASSGYPFHVGDEMQYIGSAVVDERQLESEVVIQAQVDNETVSLLFDVTVPTVSTNPIIDITSFSATCGGNVTSTGDSPVTIRGICWSTSQNPTIADNHTDDGSGTGSFNSTMTDLTPNTTYYLRAYATNSVGTGYGEQRTFTTACNPVNVNITGNTNINYGQSITLTASGADNYQWSTGATISSITLSPSSTTTYTVTGTNNYGCTATASVTVTVNPVTPTVTTNNMSNIQATSVTCGGNVTSDGGAPVTQRGVCWGTSQNPTISFCSHITNGSGTGDFTILITSLTPNTTYYVRAYATNSAGTAYGEQKSFITPCNTVNVNIAGSTTINYGQSTSLTASGANSYRWSTNATTANIIVSPTTTTTYTVTGTNSYGCTATASVTVTVNPVAPTVTTNNVSNIQATSVTCGGNVTSHGGAAVTARGVCWSTSSNPTVGNSHTTNGNGTGNFNSNLTGLMPNTTYYVRAYATNSVGTNYGEQKSFTTSCNTVTVSISGTTTINYGQSTTLTASGAGNYSWNTGATTASITVSPTSTTTYTVTGTNSYGCTATASVTVTVNPILPMVITNNFSNISESSATCGGNVTSDGGATITACGVCWSIFQEPTVSGSHTTNGSSTGTFTSNITGLNPNTTYYVRAYATNSVGTAYGEVRSLTATNDGRPCLNTPTITDIDGNVYNTVQIGDQCWMRENLRTTKYADGLAIPAGTDTSSINPYYYNYTTSIIPMEQRGLLYNWPAVMHGALSSQNNPSCVQGICPDGWHVPSDAEWDQLTSYVGGQIQYPCGNGIGKALASEVGWSYSVSDGECDPGNQSVYVNNVTGFGAVPAGCFSGMSFGGSGNNAVFWSATTVWYEHSRGCGKNLSSASGMTNTSYYKSRGNSVRCLRDVSPSIYSLSCPGIPTVTDVEGNKYNTVQIGNQCWMRENLRTTKYADGTLIPAGTDTSSTIPYYYNYTTSIIPLEQRGLLYNWSAVMHGASSSNTIPSHVQGICPNGWHVPSDAEWTQLTSYVGSRNEYLCDDNSRYIAKALAAKTGWSTNITPHSICQVGANISINNATGFSALPAGFFYVSDYGGGGGSDFYIHACFWSFTESGSLNPYSMKLYHGDAEVYIFQDNKDRGYSVRCLCDDYATTNIPSCPTVPTVADIDGNTYNTVQIGEQCWMRENLRTTHFADGSQIPSGGANSSTTVPYYYNYTSSSILLDERGLLYNWPAAMYGAASSNTIPSYVQGICPEGWHLPSDAEWTQLTTYVGSQSEYTCDDNSSYIAKALAATTGWNTNTNICAVGNDPIGNNATGFGALPAGYYNSNDYYYSGNTVYFWSSTEYNNSYTYYRNLYYGTANVNRSYNNKSIGYSVRCLRDVDVSSFIISSCPGTPTVTDIDGNTYNTVQIGNQCWMRENLRTTRYADGTVVPAGETNRSSTDAYYYDYSASPIPLDERGLLYNWPAAMQGAPSSSAIPSHVQGICPTGWHVPSNMEWSQLKNFVGEQNQYLCGNFSGSIAKALASTTRWSRSINTCAVGNTLSNNNTTGFSAIPAGSFGIIMSNYRCMYSGIYVYFWSTTEKDSTSVYFQNLACGSSGVGEGYGGKYNGYSVRCLRDEIYDAIIDDKSCPSSPTVTDHEGNVYATVQIGSQCWMRDNLRTTTSPSTGTYLIPSAGPTYTFTGKQARWYNNDSTTYAPMNYGLLYNWNAAVDTFNTAYGEISVNTNNAVSVSFSGNRRGICPAGWHLPSDAEWTQLIDYVSSQSQYVCGSNNTYIAKALTTTTGWNTSSNTCAVGNNQADNNATGFSALPAGVSSMNSNSSHFIDLGRGTWFWSATKSYNSSLAYAPFLGSMYADVYKRDNFMCAGYSVRCLRDADTALIDEKSCPAAPTVTDHEGNVYATVQIGRQCWMRDNLRTTTSPSTGTYLIPAAGTGYTYTGKQARWYNDDSTTYAPMNYGLLYNWNAAVDTFNTAYGETSVNTINNGVSVSFTGYRRGICPAGWHLPSDVEWNTMEATVSGSNWLTSYETVNGSRGNHAGKLAGGNYWDSSSTSGSPGEYNNTNRNASGFSAFPAGSYSYGSYGGFGSYASFWSSSENNFVAACRRILYYSIASVDRHPYCSKGYECSVRCLRDAGVAIIDDKSCPAAPTVTDHEGNVYATVQIGNQCWMRDNLRTTTSPSTGTYLIPTAGTTYTYTGKQARWYNNNSTTYAPMNYGLLYNWNAAVDTFNTAFGETSVNYTSNNAVSVSFAGNRRGICPEGWHLPSDAEWTQLANNVGKQSEYVCGEINIAKALADSTGWNTSINPCAVGKDLSSNNATGFSAFPAGGYYGSYDSFGSYAGFWSSTESSGLNAWIRYLYYDYAYVFRDYYYKIYGFSVRCLCDAAADVIDTLHLHDLGILSMLNPTTRCDLGLESIVLTITNNGTQDLLPGTAMHYSINGLPAVNETLTDTLHSHETKTFRFNTQFDFTNNLIDSNTTYNILVWATKDAQDRLQYNDTLRQTIASRGKSALPIVQDPVNVSYYTRGTLTAHLPSSISQGVIGWFANTGFESWELLGYTDSTYQTPYIFFDTTFYANANPGYVFDTIVGDITGSEVGNGTAPFIFTKGYSRGRMLYTESEIGQHGPITTIGLYVNSLTNVGEGGIPIKLYLKETSMASFPSNASIDWDNEVLDATLIVDEKVFFDHCGWHYFTLSTPFNYNSGNLIVLTETNCADYCTGTGTQCNNCGEFVSGGTGYPNFRHTNCATGFVQYKYNNTLPMTGNYMNYTKRLTMSFKINNLDCGSEMVPIHIHVPDIPTYDVYTVSLDYPSSGCALYDEHIQVTIKNMLNTPIPAGKVNVHAVINGTIITETINEIILPEKSKTVTFSQPYDFSAPYNNNTFNYVIYTTMNNEGVVYTRNDTISGQITSIHTAGLQDSYTYVGSYMNSMTILQPNDRLSDVLFYYFFDSSGTLIHTTSATVPYYTTPALYDSAVFWVAAKTKTSNCITRSVPVYINVGMPTYVIDSKSCPATPTVTDHEGNVYATVQIGNQCWMRDNLRTTTSPTTGTYLIPAAGIGYTYTGKQARWYNNDSTTYAPMNYGLLYNWNAAVDTFNTAYGETSVNTSNSNAVSVSFSGNRRGICPAGWHLPSNAEWTTMINFVSSQSEYVCGDTNINIAKALADSTGWITYNDNCAVGNDPSVNNATGFSALPAGLYFDNFYNSGGTAIFWSSTSGDGSSAGNYLLSYHSAIVSWNGAVHKNIGFSVRCLRD